MKIVRTKMSQRQKELQELGKNASTEALQFLKEKGIDAYVLNKGKVEVYKDTEK